MKIHNPSSLLTIFSLLWLGAGCAIDQRTGKALADWLASGPVREYASTQAEVVAEAALVLQQQGAPNDGSMLDLGGAKKSWLKARAAYDRGVAVFAVLTPELAVQIDGPFDDALATRGLRHLERVLFGSTPAQAAEIAQLAHALSDATFALRSAVPDGSRPLDAATVLGSMSATAAFIATKLDGSLSPYAGASLLSIESNLLGLQAMYAILSPLVSGGNSELDAHITGLLQTLLDRIRSYPSVDAVTDKRTFLRECAELGLLLKQVGKVLGLSVTTINLS